MRGTPTKANCHFRAVIRDRGTHVFTARGNPENLVGSSILGPSCPLYTAVAERIGLARFDYYDYDLFGADTAIVD